jgi:hypothetical protein
MNSGREKSDENIPDLQRVTRVRDESELREVARLDAEAYGGRAIDYAGLYDWWKAYPKGAYVLWVGSKIVGAFGIWSIKKAIYNKILRGEMDETEIKAEHIIRKPADKTHSYWYLADIVLQKEYPAKSKRQIWFLLDEAIKLWREEVKHARKIHLCALGFAPQGVSFLQKFKFSPAGNSFVVTHKGNPVYQRILGIKDVDRALDYANARRNGRLKSGPAQPYFVDVFDVFISYRRNPDKIRARALERRLQKRGLRVFLDASDMPFGRFPKILRDNVINTPNFIVMLSKDCFQRCSDKSDWFRREISLALKNRKNIIPIYMKDFEFPHNPEELPRSMRDLKDYQAIIYQNHCFDEVIEKIAEGI